MTSKMIALAAAVMALASGGATQAGFVVNVTESGGNVLAIGSGTLNTTDLMLVPANFSATSTFNGIAATAVLGDSSTPALGSFYTGISGPTNFGSGTMYENPTSGTGDLVGVDGNSGYLYQQSNGIVTPRGYVSGDFLSASDTFAGQTLSSLGFTTGTYVWTWGSGADADSFTMNIGTASAVPEPSSLVLMGIGGIATLGCAWRRRRTKVVG